MAFVIGLLSFVMVLDCVFLTLLVLIQLPKKEAGAGLAFGASATDALFGAGSGNVLTKITKYAAVTFFILAIFLSVMQSVHYNRRTAAFTSGLGKTPRQVGAPIAPATPPARATAPTTTTGTAPAESTPPASASTNIPLLNIPAAESTNSPAPK
jgi:preprotein translocase subunit SecG